MNKNKIKLQYNKSDKYVLHLHQLPRGYLKMKNLTKTQ